MHDIARRLRSTYDHFEFPGAVPRTFLGAFLLAGASKPILAVAGWQHAQLVVRAVLGLLNALALLKFKSRLGQAFGNGVARWYAVLQAAQFHVLFYASRTLPNMLAFGLTTLAFSQFLPIPAASAAADKTASRQRTGIYLLVLAGVIFRAEIALLLATQVLFLLHRRTVSLHTVITTGITSALIALAISVPLDSYFWLRPLWPELSSFIFNAVHGASSDWGTSPWHTYLSSFLPKLLLNPLAIALIIYSLLLPALSRAATALTLPSIAFIILYSIQPHKEARFIIYTIPPLTAAAALSASHIWTRRRRTKLHRLGSLILVASIALSALASLAMLAVSALNYPGGEALWALHQYVARAGITGTLHVHMDVLSCMTGVSRFQQEHPSAPIWRAFSSSSQAQTARLYDKTEDEQTLADPGFWSRFDYVLAEEPARVMGAWDVVDTVYGFAGLEVLRPGQGVSETGDQEVLESLRGLLRRRPASAGNDAAAAGLEMGRTESLAGELGTFGLLREGIRRFVTRGWWIGPRMEGKIRIMKRISPSSLEEVVLPKTGE
jgi:alpha-1,6-mannosyltransferase